LKKNLEKVYLGLGANLPPELETLDKTINIFRNSQLFKNLKQSSIYKSAPIGNIKQPYFYNCVIEIDTILTPIALLKFCLKTEEQLGRKRTIIWGPRNIDIDILLYSNKIVYIDNLKIPHPELLNRAFVILPLLELNFDILIPPENIKLADYYNNSAALKKQECIKLNN